jgi:hypothetical protein
MPESGSVEVFWSFYAPVCGEIMPQSGRKFTYAVVLKSEATSTVKDRGMFVIEHLFHSGNVTS